MKGYLRMFLFGAALMATQIACSPGKTTPSGAPAPAPQPPVDVVSDIENPDQPTEDQIAFLSQAPNGGGGWASAELYRMNSNGSGIERLTRNNDSEFAPNWAADGRSIVYTCGSKTICISNPDGTKQRTLFVSPTEAWVYEPTLSPDGSKLAFSSGVIGTFNKDIQILDIPTNTLTNFTASPTARDESPVWHPLGGLAWIRAEKTGDLVADKVMYAPGGSDDVFVITDDTSTRYKYDLDVSPDGDRFVYSAAASGAVDIFLYDVDTDAVTKLTQTATLPDYGPSFSPDGTQIAFARKDQPSDMDTEIYKMNVDGSGIQRLTANNQDDRSPDWGKPAATISIGDADADEGDPGDSNKLDFKVTLSTVQTSAVSVKYTVTPISASGADISLAGGTVTFAPGEKVKTVSVPITGDTEVETSESFKVTLSVPVGAIIGDGEGRGLIRDDEVAPSPSPSVTPSVTPSGSPTPAGPGVIAFSSTRNAGNFDIWIMDDDGTDARSLTNDPAFDGGAEVSPDGLNVIFQRGVDGPPDIYSVPTSGGTPSKINGTSAAADVTPSYKPDGSAIVWASGDGTSTKLLTASPRAAAPTVMADEPGDEAYPSWGTLSNGNSAVAFQVQNGDTDFSLRLKNLTTGMTTNLGEGRHPEISPDGTKLVYSSVAQGGLDIYVRDLTNASATPTRLTTDNAEESTPTWSPDGTRIAFTNSRDGNAEIYVMNANGSGQTNITNNPADDFEPSWGPSPSASQAVAPASAESPGSESQESESPTPASPTPSPSGSLLIPIMAGLSLAARRFKGTRKTDN